MSTLVFLEHHGGELQKGSLAVLSKAASLGGDVAGVIVGAGLDGFAEQAAAHGAATVYVADDPKLEAPLPQPRVDAIAQLVGEKGIETILFAQSILASDIASGLAARLEAGLNWQLTDIVDGDGGLGRQAVRPRRLGRRRRRLDVDASHRPLPRGRLRSVGAARRGDGRAVRRAAAGALARGGDGRAGARRGERAVDRGRGRDRRRRPRSRRAGEVRAGRGAREGARRRGRRDPRGRRRRLVPVLGAGRADRASRSRRPSTSPVGSRARSSTRSACRARRRSSRSTRTRTRRSSSSPTSASSATCTRSCRS